MLIRVIEQYLENHKRLVVPQLGAFLVKEEPRTVVFSELLRRDDGVLQGLLVAEGMTELAARGEIDRLVYEVRHAVEQGERYFLSSFGEFYAGEQGTIHFDFHPRLSVVPEEPVDIMSDIVEKVRPEVKSAEPVAPAPVVAPESEKREPEKREPLYIPELDEDDLTLDGYDEDSDEEIEASIEEVVEEDEEPQPTPVAKRRAPRRKPQRPQKQKPDRFLWVAIAAAVIALLAIAFGLYNDSLKGNDMPSADEPELIEPLIETAAQSDPYGELND